MSPYIPLFQQTLFYQKEASKSGFSFLILRKFLTASKAPENGQTEKDTIGPNSSKSARDRGLSLRARALAQPPVIGILFFFN